MLVLYAIRRRLRVREHGARSIQHLGSHKQRTETANFFCLALRPSQNAQLDIACFPNTSSIRP